MKARLQALARLILLTALFLWQSPLVSGSELDGSKPATDSFRYGQYDAVISPVPDLTSFGNIPSTYTAYGTLLTQSGYIASGDLENDGYKDMVSSSYYDGYIAILHQSTTTHQLELVALRDVTQGGSTNGVRDVYVADMNGDCLRDIVVFDVLNGLVAIFLQTGEYGVFTRTQVDTGIMYSRGGVGDLNNDGFSDLLWTDERYVFVAYQTLTGFTAADTFSATYPPTRLMDQPAVGDVNGDGLADLVAVDGYSDALFVWESPTMQLRVLGAPSNVPENVAVGDLDGDGVEDIAIPGGGTDKVAVTWGGVFTTTTLVGIGNKEDVAIGDVDDDGKLELVATDKQSYHLIIWDCDDRNCSRQIIDANVIPGDVVISDLDGNGLNDVAYGIAGYTSPPDAPVTVHYQTGVGLVKPRIECLFVYLPLGLCGYPGDS